jgi:hypothetical protein
LTQRPEYLALNQQGIEYIRPAQIVDELPQEARSDALVEATSSIALKTGLVAIKRIPFGSPVFTAFNGMNRHKAKSHKDSLLMLTNGGDVSLDYCPSYQ